VICCICSCVLGKKELFGTDHFAEKINHKVIICGITRDNAQDLPVMMHSIELTGDAFMDYRVVIFENDSKDGTKEILRKWQETNPKVKIVTQDFHNNKRPNIQFMANCRNKYLEEIDLHKEIYDPFDYLIVVDMDMRHGWDIKILIDSFKHQNEHKWDVVCSNGLSSENVMYDAFAFRDNEFPQNHREAGYWTEVVPKIQSKKRDKWQEVQSCFGGLAIYKREKIGSCRYSSDEDDCEHVYFHRCIRNNGGKVFLNPDQKIKYLHYT